MRGIYSLKTLQIGNTAPLLRRILGTFLAIVAILYIVAMITFAILITNRVEWHTALVSLRVFAVVLASFSGLAFLLIALIAHTALNPLNRLIDWVRRAESLDKIESPTTASQEISEIYEILNTTLERLNRTQLELVNAERDAAIGKISSQVAHDIRSPLAALNMIVGNLSELPEDKRVIVRSAVSRIKDIASDLLNKSVIKTDENYDSVSHCLILNLIEDLITEKRLQYRTRLGVEIDIAITSVSYGQFVSVNSAAFKRVLSNILDNSVEAIGEKGRVYVSLGEKNDTVNLMVKDDGKGIPIDILPLLMQKGKTFGKPNGSGLGLFHARKTLESWDGKLSIESEFGVGTTVTISLPKVSPPDWFVHELALSDDTNVIILDDDSSVHQIWQKRFSSELMKNEVLHFSTATELRTWASAAKSKSKEAVYLIDYELLGETTNGLALIEELGISSKSILVTSRFEDPPIRAQSKRLGIKLIPKGLAGFVPIANLAQDKRD